MRGGAPNASIEGLMVSIRCPKMPSDRDHKILNRGTVFLGLEIIQSRSWSHTLGPKVASISMLRARVFRREELKQTATARCRALREGRGAGEGWREKERERERKTNTHTHTHTHTNTHPHPHTPTHTHTPTHPRTHAPTHPHTHTRTHAHTHIRTHAHTAKLQVAPKVHKLP